MAEGWTKFFVDPKRLVSLGEASGARRLVAALLALDPLLDPHAPRARLVGAALEAVRAATEAERVVLLGFDGSRPVVVDALGPARAGEPFDVRLVEQALQTGIAVRSADEDVVAVPLRLPDGPRVVGGLLVERARRADALERGDVERAFVLGQRLLVALAARDPRTRAKAGPVRQEGAWLVQAGRGRPVEARPQPARASETRGAAARLAPAAGAPRTAPPSRPERRRGNTTVLRRPLDAPARSADADPNATDLNQTIASRVRARRAACDPEADPEATRDAAPAAGGEPAAGGRSERRRGGATTGLGWAAPRRAARAPRREPLTLERLFGEATPLPDYLQEDES